MSKVTQLESSISEAQTQVFLAPSLHIHVHDLYKNVLKTTHYPGMKNIA